MAASESSLPTGIVARPLRESDLDTALSLSRDAGWNQVAADWRIFLELGDAICLARGDEPLFATAATLPHSGSLAWISMVLVTAAERRRGFARWLLRHCRDDLLARKLVPALDATPAGREVYLRLGFADRWTTSRLVGGTLRVPEANDGAATVRPLAASDWPQLAAYDAVAFGADRTALLRRLAERVPQAALIADRDGQIVGFSLGRNGRVMTQLGPLAANDEKIARALLTRAIATLEAPLVIDVPDRHITLRSWLAALGFTAERPLMRMVYGTSLEFDDSTRLFAIAGPELG
jgi:GNAT superfamily N-acetyltransferase